jgi:hypothetical protein
MYRYQLKQERGVMKLGICYMVFDGEEFLEFATSNIRNQIDHISVTYQTTSYFGNPSSPDIFDLLNSLKNKGLIDQIIHFEPNLELHPKENELKLRNIGLEASRNANCTHHISADVDEFYDANQLEYVKKEVEGNDYEFTVAYMEVYYKDPTFLVTPSQNLLTSLIHPVDNEYNKDIHYPEFPFHMETTRRFSKYKKYRVFTKEEFLMHHYSYVRKDILKKFNNSDNGRFYKMKKFLNTFDTYKVGERVCLLPDFMNRKTVQVENKFGIHF